MYTESLHRTDIGDASSGKETDPQSRLYVGTWNIQMGKNIATVVDQVATAPVFDGLDFLVLNEASAGEKTHASLVAEVLSERTHHNYRYFDYASTMLGDEPQMNGLIWNEDRIPAVSVDAFHLTPLAEGSASQFEKLLYSWRTPQIKNSIRFEGMFGNHLIRAYGKHEDIVGLSGHRVTQVLDVLHDNNRREPAAMTLILGDTNIHGLLRTGEIDRTLEQHGFVEMTRRIGGTFRTVPFQRLDRMYVNSGQMLDMTFRSYVAKVPGSDHYPVFSHLFMKS